MRKKETTWKKVLASAVLLTVILIIHAVKIFHAHESLQTFDWETQNVKVAKQDSCLICDYTITKASYPTLTSVAYTRQIVCIDSPILYRSRTTSSSTGLSYSDRGPPALA